MKNIKYKILLLLFGISLISSLILSLIPVPVVCDPGVGCDVVQTSTYNQTFGIKNSYYGVVIFLILIFLTLSHMKNPTEKKRILIHTGVIIGALISLYFLYLQRFILQAFCKYCLIVDFSILVSLLVILFYWKK